LGVAGGVLTDLLPIFEDGTWAILTDPSSEAYHVLWGPLIVFELVGNFAQILVALVALVFFAQKSALFPRVLIGLYLGVLVFLVADYLLAELIPAVAVQDSSESLGLIGRQLAVCAVWVPYMLRSKRVRNTFVG
jgi:ABC-type multidrug transport system permease subunit